MNNLTTLLGRKQPVGRERDETEARLGAAEGVGEHAVMIRSDIEIVHGACDVEIRVGVEAIDEAQSLVAQITLYLEVGVEAERHLFAVLEIAPEFVMPRRV